MPFWGRNAVLCVGDRSSTEPYVGALLTQGNIGERPSIRLRMGGLSLHVPVVSSAGIVDKFSALCFLYASRLYDSLAYPIGVIASSWGGTTIEPWSSPVAMAACPSHGRKRVPWPTTPSVSWNAMIHPYLQTTIYGAIWYQGESNAGHSDMYACQFPAMIADWRQQFHTGTDGETDTLFPFGFVQLAPFRPGDVAGGFPALRWAQTAQQGHAPNSRMPNTFMAVAIDLPDFQSTSGQ